MGPFTAWAVVLRHAVIYHMPNIGRRHFGFVLLSTAGAAILIALALNGIGASTAKPGTNHIVMPPSGATRMASNTAYTRGALFKMLVREGFIHDRTHFPAFRPEPRDF